MKTPAERSQPTLSQRVKPLIAAALLAVTLSLGVGGAVNHVDAKRVPPSADSLDGGCRYAQDKYLEATTQAERDKWESYWIYYRDYGSISDTSSKPVPPTQPPVVDPSSKAVNTQPPTPTPAIYKTPVPPTTH